MTSTIGNSTNFDPPKVAITMGDPAGIGPEICAKLVADSNNYSNCLPIILGDWEIFSLYTRQLELNSKLTVVRTLDELDWGECSNPVFVDFAEIDIAELELGCASAKAGNSAYKYIESAIKMHLNNKVDAIVTGPINKLSLHAAGFDFPGHTEIFAAKTGTTDFCMMQYSNELTCSFVTTHIGYGDVLTHLNSERIAKVIRLTDAALTKINGYPPKLVVCGLNPHAGENGLFGNGEEESIIVPAIELTRGEDISVEGPYPPDTCFVPSRRQTTDGFICMYHDQGHIPLKALAFDKAVNVTLGLPIIRTSVDHGTAFDIVGKNQANPSSLIEAVQLATKMALAKQATV